MVKYQPFTVWSGKKNLRQNYNQNDWTRNHHGFSATNPPLKEKYLSDMSIVYRSGLINRREAVLNLNESADRAAIDR